MEHKSDNSYTIRIPASWDEKDTIFSEWPENATEINMALLPLRTLQIGGCFIEKGVHILFEEHDETYDTGEAGTAYWFGTENVWFVTDTFIAEVNGTTNEVTFLYGLNE